MLALVFGLPLLVTAMGGWSIENRYTTRPHGDSLNFQFYHHALVKDTAPVDVAFVGSSGLWSAIDCDWLERQLTKDLGRKSRVLCLFSRWRHDNLYYQIVHDLLERQRVGVLFTSFEYEDYDDEHPSSASLWDPTLTRGLVTALPWRYLAALYTHSILGAPRMLLATLRHNDRLGQTKYGQDSVSFALACGGGFRDELRMAGDAELSTAPDPMLEAKRHPPVFKPEQMIYDGRPNAWFAPIKKHETETEEIFDRGILRMAQERHVRHYRFYYPNKWFRSEPTVPLHTLSASGPFETMLPSFGIPLTELFKNFSDEEVDGVFSGYTHLKVEGARFFTEAIYPGVLNLVSSGT